MMLTNTTMNNYGDRMFYEEEIVPTLRFGDIIKGFISTYPKIQQPIIEFEEKNDYNIQIQIPKYSVVLTPCCSLIPKRISITPLIPILSSFLKNNHFAEDLTRINRLVEPQFHIPEEDWNKLTLNERTKREKGGKAFTLLNYFIYDKHPLFSPYELKSKKLQHYMIDFNRISNVYCESLIIKRGVKAPDEILKAKILQLTVEARRDLREKLGNYFERVAPEDEKELLD